MRHYDGGTGTTRKQQPRADGGRDGGRPPRTAEDDVDNGLNGLNGCGKVDYAQGDGRSASHSPVSLSFSLRAQPVFIVLAAKPYRGQLMTY